MRVLKWIFVVFLLLLLLAQVPFVYRRYQLGQVAGKIAATNANRQPAADDRYKEYKGIIHAHTSLGGHSTGGFDELIAAANANDLDFVLMTEHWSDSYDTSALTLNGLYGKTLFVGGNEIDTADGDRFLMIPGSSEAAGLRKMSTAAVIEKLHSENRLALVTYPEKFNSWNSDFDGIEVFSLHTEAKKANQLLAMFDLIWSYPSYPELTLMRNFQRPDENLKKFDEVASKRPITLFAGTDAHSNIGFHVFGDDAGHKTLNIKLDPYETIFRIARMHVLIEKDKVLNRDTLIEAIKAGRFFVGFDAAGDSSGFRFAISRSDHEWNSGDSLAFQDGITLKASIPGFYIADFVVYCNGEVILDSRDHYATSVETALPTAGVYRVEAYRRWLGSPFDQFPWIISNPIYVR